jgi:hypothetical protein
LAFEGIGARTERAAVDRGADQLGVRVHFGAGEGVIGRKPPQNDRDLVEGREHSVIGRFDELEDG